MTEPLVCAIMLTKDRPEMARRAVASFRAQTYQHKMLFAFDTGITPLIAVPRAKFIGPCETYEHYGMPPAGMTIGAKRNKACAQALAEDRFDIFVHFDDDDYSHPDRIAEQVELLQSSGADCVGYNEVLFWRTWGLHSVSSGYPLYNDLVRGEAWIYRSPRMSPAIGSSLCYWRSTWERRPFADAPKAQGATSEYYEWLRHCNVKATSSLSETKITKTINTGAISSISVLDVDPRLICSIHGGNTQCYDIEALIAQGSREWTRAQGLDAYARKVMTL